MYIRRATVFKLSTPRLQWMTENTFVGGRCTGT